MRYITKEIYENIETDKKSHEIWVEACKKTDSDYPEARNKLSKKFVEYYERDFLHDYYIKEIRSVYNKDETIDIFMTLEYCEKCRTIKYKSVSEFQMNLKNPDCFAPFKFCFNMYMIGEIYLENNSFCHCFMYNTSTNEIKIKCKKIILL